MTNILLSQNLQHFKAGRGGSPPFVQIVLLAKFLQTRQNRIVLKL